MLPALPACKCGSRFPSPFVPLAAAAFLGVFQREAKAQHNSSHLECSGLETTSSPGKFTQHLGSAAPSLRAVGRGAGAILRLQKGGRRGIGVGSTGPFCAVSRGVLPGPAGLAPGCRSQRRGRAGTRLTPCGRRPKCRDAKRRRAGRGGCSRAGTEARPDRLWEERSQEERG